MLQRVLKVNKIKREFGADNLKIGSEMPLSFARTVAESLRRTEEQSKTTIKNYLRAKRSKSAIWRSISSRAESEAERMP
jgi:hypothetical protein